MINTIEVSQYNGVKDNTGDVCTIESIVTRIQANTVIKKQIDKLRASRGKDAETLKKKLLAFTWSGKFEKRKADSLIEYSNLICLDFDKLPDAEATKQSIISQAPLFLYCLFISPSGNGLKAVCRVSGGVEQHLNNFNALKYIFRNIYNLEVDESGKDVSRLCFISSDLNIYINDDAVPFSGNDLEVSEATKEPVPVAPVVAVSNIQKDLEQLVEFTNKKNNYNDGNRNNYIHHFACNANRKGLDIDAVLDFVATNFDIYHEDPKGTENTVKSAYKNNIVEFGKYSKANYKKQQETMKALAKEKGKYNDSELFYYEVETKDKNSDGDPITEKKFSYRQCINFLANNGFYRYANENSKAFDFVKVEGFLIDFVTESEIRDFVFEYVQDMQLFDVEEMLLRAVNRYLSSNIFERLPFLNNYEQN